MSRIKIAIGPVQIEYEGDQDFIQNGLLEFAKQALDLGEAIPPTVTTSKTATTVPTIQHELSTNTIAQTIGVKTGSDLALAAIAKINLIKQQSTASRQSVLDEMREATTYFKDSYAGNLSAYLDTLVKSKKVNLVSRGTYALAAAERSKLEQALASVG